RFVGVKGARIVLHDPAGVRDLLTASWLVQFGRNEVYVLRDSASVEIEIGPEPKRVVRLGARAPSILASELKALVDAGEAHVVDLAGANAFRKAHIPGAAYAERSELAALVAAAEGKAAVVTSEDGILAYVASAALSPGQRGNLRVLLGGNAEWRARGYPTESGGLDLEAGGDIPDRYGLPEARRNELFRRYLDWEVSLVDSLGADPDVRFAIRSFASH
ncbi:MAG: hypothetical protein IT535_06745, partial [Bauldia sp.]|nr:hypothetical protein [Bauldia sp.]